MTLCFLNKRQHYVDPARNANDNVPEAKTKRGRRGGQQTKHLAERVLRQNSQSFQNMSVPRAHVLLQQRRARCLSIPPSQHCVRKGRESLGEWCVSCASSASIQAFDAQLWPGFVKGGLCSVYLRGSSLLGNSSLYCQTHGSPDPH